MCIISTEKINLRVPKDCNTCLRKYFSVKPNTLRIADGRHEGRLEFFHNNKWGTICDDGFTQTAARIACQSLGYRYPYYIYLLIQFRPEPSSAVLIIIISETNLIYELTCCFSVTG